MATPQGESLVCAQCYMERGPVVDLFTHGCFYPHQSSHLKAPRLAISTSHVPPSPQAASGVVYKERQVRPPPTNCLRVTRFHLCKFRPPITCRSGDLCTYAHSEEELKAWNRHAFVGPTRTVLLPRREAEKKHMQPSAVVGQDQRRVVSANHQPKNTIFSERVKDDLKLEDIQAELTIENYKDKFHNLLCWEEMEHISILHDRCDNFYSLKMFVDSVPQEIKWSIEPHKKYGCLNVGDGDIIAYATQASESVHLIVRQNNRTNDFEAKILRDNYWHTGNNLYISVDKRCILPNSCKEIECQFEVKHSFFDTLHKVLNKLPDEMVRRILPLSEDFNGVVRTDVRTIFKNIPEEYKGILHLSDVNEDELVPYKVALSCQSGAPPVLISGAFGTGKTCFLSSIAYCFISEAERNKLPARVLICAHHQATADTILQTYFGPMLGYQSPHRVKVVRITPKRYHISSSQKYVHLYENIGDFNSHFQEYSFVERLVVITTFLTSIHLKLYPFTHILIDEGAQAREPEAVAPLCLADMNTKIIIAGDPRQVGPGLLVLGEEARKYGLKASLLERLKAHYRSIGKPNMLQANLMKNFRCHQQILKFASEMFYKSLVTPSHVTSSCWSHPGFSFPLVFVCTSKEIVDHYDKAVNRDEASIVMGMLGKNLEIEQKNVRNVCVMSSSRGQVTVLRNMKSKWNMPESVYVLPTYDIQGQEYDLLYISTCEPTYSNGETRNPTKSICDPFVFNTAITRARSLIVSFGNPYLLLSIEEHMNQTYKGGGCCWSQYLLTCMQRGTLIIPDSIIGSPNEKKLYKDNLTDILKSRVSKAPVCAAKPRHLPPQGHLDVSRSPPAKHPSSSERLIFSGQSKYRDPSHVRFKPMVSVTSNCSTLPNKGPSSASHEITSSKQLPSMKNGTKSPLTLPKKWTENAQIPSNITQPTLESRQQISPAFKPRESFDKGLSSGLPTRQYDSQGMCSSSLLDKEFPDAMKQKMPKRDKNSISSSHHDVVRELPKHTTYFQKYKEKPNTQMFETPYTLTVDNYQESFHHLLCWEEKEHMSILANRCNGRYHVKIFEKQPICTRRETPPWLNTHNIQYNCYGTISNANDDDDDDVISYAKQAAEAAYLALDGKRVHVNFIESGMHAEEEAIPIGIAEKLSSFKKWEKQGSKDISFDCYVMFELKHSYFHRQHEALDALAPHVLERLLPKERANSNPQQFKPMIARNKSLYLDSSGQMQALTAILNQRDNPVIIAGPFGTGKTRVLARATYELLRQNIKSRILICTHHQVSADTFIHYFGYLQEEKTFFSSVKIVRIATTTYCSKIKAKYPGYYVSSKRAISLTPQVIVCTLGLSCHLKSLKGLTHIFIDEAAQTRETEAIIPLQLAEIQTRIVLAGDHCQVDPDLLVLGDEARRYGLSTSLLQRLHQKYNEIGETTCSFSLLCNYRSHSGLLMLPSSLFYCSTLQCNVSDTVAHPKAPFPLVFVCSSIKNLSSANCKSTDENEAKILVNEVQKYTCRDSWPAVWEKRDDPDDPSKICIMTPSAAQKCVIAKKIKSKHSGVDVLKAYEIQGCEFMAVFLGTCETTDEKGVPKNLTKTIINRYVFNAVVTRARYLVVAVGNPLQLLDKEEKMCQMNLQDRRFQCWKEYIRRCIECRSFHLPKGVKKDEVENFTKLLYQRVFSPTERETQSSGSTFYGNQLSKDTVLSAYKKKFESIPECRHSKLKLTRVNGTLSWNMSHSSSTTKSETVAEDESEDVSEGSVETYPCRLNMFSFSKGEAIPLDTSKRVVQLKGMGNIKGAFHEDVVEVAVFSKLPQSACKGRIIKVIKECHKQNIVCKAHRYNPVLFCPIDKRYRIISNLPKLSKNLLERKDKCSIDAELQSKDVVIFEPNSLLEGNIPEIKNVIPHTIAQDLLFVVRILLWNPKFRFPLGVVVHALPKGCSFFHAERLLMIEHNVHYDKEDSYKNDQHITVQYLPNECDIDTRAFTIDPEDAVNLDDAISLTEKNGSYQLAVHIVNTTKEIPRDTEVDKKAAAYGVSVYGVKRVMNMLPAETRSKLSLQPYQICDVMTVSVNVVINEGSIAIAEEVEFKESQIKSCAKLSYKSAQDIMDGSLECSRYQEIYQCMRDYDSAHGQPSLKETLEILFKVAMRLRIDRLGSLAALSYEMDDQNEQDCWKMYLMVEEMMIWANSAIARELLSAYPECALLRKQNPPNAEEVAAASSQSYTLSDFIQQSLPAILVTPNALLLLSEALRAKNTNLLMNLLTEHSLFPQLSTSSSHLRRIQQKAEYIPTTVEMDPSTYCHYSLNLPSYTHFTSPLRRYADIIVQRMLKSLINREECPYKHDDIALMCHTLNGAVQNAKSFEKKMKTLMLAVEYTQSSEVYEAVVTRNTRTDIEIALLSKVNGIIPAKQKQFKVRHLKCRELQTVSEGWLPHDAPYSATYSWKVKVLSLDDQSSFPYNCADLSLPSSHQDTAQNTQQVSMNLFVKLESGMLKSVSINVEVPPYARAILPDNWKCSMNFLQNPSEEDFTEIERVVNSLTTPGPKPLSEAQDQIDSPIVMCNVKCQMDLNDVVKVWMTWSSREAILSPQLQLIEITPFFHICLQHNAHPAECFSDSYLVNASKPHYSDLDEYVSLWEKVVLAEAAERSVNDKRTAIIRDVKLKWPELVVPERIDEAHYEPKNFITLVIPAPAELSPFLKVHVGDLMCVRYGTRKDSNVRAVFHMVVAEHRGDECKPPEKFSLRSVGDDEYKPPKIFSLKSVGKDQCRLSERIKPLINDSCEIEIISMSPSYQRVYKVLLSLKHKTKVSELLKAVARGKDDNILFGKLPPKHVVNLEPLTTDDLTTTLWSHNKPLNSSQLEAVKLSLRRRFQLIQGPPGTGKSETGAHIAYTLAMSNRMSGLDGCVLYCAPTNKAVDVVLRNLHLLSKKPTNVKILRIYGHAVERREFPGPHTEKETFQISESEYRQPQWARKYALHCIIRDDPQNAELREMERMFSDEYKQGHISGAKKYHEWKALVNDAEQNVLIDNFDIVLCTCNEAASMRIVNLRLLQCIIDESGMASEPETIVPMSLCEHVILLGDHKQLQPVIEYKPARENGLTTSLFERYAKSRETKVLMLNIQYRMHEEICKFPSKHFYNGQLKTDHRVIKRTNQESNFPFWPTNPKGSKYPIIFCDIVSEEETQVGRSKFNPREAEKVVLIARVIHQVYKAKLSEIALMTPYRAQKDCIKKLANDAGLLNTDGLTVATITESQGDEYGIVILSTVRSQPLAEIVNEDLVQPDQSWLLENLGFLTDEHQINVGITRSKYGLIIVGNKILLKYDDTWGALINHYEERGCVFHESQFPTKDDLDKL